LACRIDSASAIPEEFRSSEGNWSLRASDLLEMEHWYLNNYSAAGSGALIKNASINVGSLFCMLRTVH